MKISIVYDISQFKLPKKLFFSQKQVLGICLKHNVGFKPVTKPLLYVRFSHYLIYARPLICWFSGPEKYQVSKQTQNFKLKNNYKISKLLFKFAPRPPPGATIQPSNSKYKTLPSILLLWNLLLVCFFPLKEFFIIKKILYVQ